MWTPESRAEHDRDDLRYPSDLTDAEWQILAPLPPPPAETGCHRCWPMRELMNAIFFVLRGGCPWRMLPEHFPPHHTTYRWFTGSATTERGKPSTATWCCWIARPVRVGDHRQSERQDRGSRRPLGL